jgi:hypothetical protein
MTDHACRWVVGQGTPWFFVVVNDALYVVEQRSTVNSATDSTTYEYYVTLFRTLPPEADNARLEA